MNERGLVKLFLRPISYKNKSVVLFWKQQTIYNSSTTYYYQSACYNVFVHVLKIEFKQPMGSFPHYDALWFNSTHFQPSAHSSGIID